MIGEIFIFSEIEYDLYISCFFMYRSERIPQSGYIYLTACECFKFKVSQGNGTTEIILCNMEKLFSNYSGDVTRHNYSNNSGSRLAHY